MNRQKLEKYQKIVLIGYIMGLIFYHVIIHFKIYLTIYSYPNIGDAKCMRQIAGIFLTIADSNAKHMDLIYTQVVQSRILIYSEKVICGHKGPGTSYFLV